MSRPREMDRAVDRLFARSQLAQAVPALEALRREVRDSSAPLDRSTAEDLLRKVVEDIEHVRDDASLMAQVAGTAENTVAAAILKYIKATRTRTNAATVRSVIDQLTKECDNDQSKALLDIVLATTRPAKISTYAENLLDLMLANGLTKNGTTSGQIRAILAILADQNFGKGDNRTTSHATPARPHPVVAAPWIDLPNPVPGFVFTPEKVNQNVYNRAVLDAGLPPATHIDFFFPRGALVLANAESNSDRANFAWRAMKDWLTSKAANDLRLDQHRKPAWTFLLGHVHGFLEGVPKLYKVSFASPYASNEVIHAQRVTDDGADR